jgi:hypothetical protein
MLSDVVVQNGSDFFGLFTVASPRFITKLCIPSAVNFLGTIREQFETCRFHSLEQQKDNCCAVGSKVIPQACSSNVFRDRQSFTVYGCFEARDDI